MRSWTLNQLRTFIAVAKAGTMSAAATELGYTVGAISQQMSALQLETGTTLFIKDGRSLVLSDAGHLLLTHALQILDAEQAANKAIGDLQGGIKSIVKLGIFGSSALGCASPAVNELRKSDPDIRITLQEIDPESAAQEVVSGAVDIALCLEYSDAPMTVGTSLNRETLLTEPLLVVSQPHAPGKETAGHLSNQAIRELGKRLGWLLPADRTAFGRAARKVVAEFDENLESPHSVTDAALALALSTTGHGLTIATQTILDFHQSNAAILARSETCSSLLTLAKTAMLQRPSVKRVQQALLQAAQQARQGRA